MRNALVAAMVALCVSVCVGSAATPAPTIVSVGAVVNNKYPTMVQYNVLKDRVNRIYNCFDKWIPITVYPADDGLNYVVQPTGDDPTTYLVGVDASCLSS